MVEFELDNGKKVKGTIVFVGSNFVELFVDGTHPIDCEDVKGILSEKQTDKESTKNNYEEENVLEHVSDERIHKKGRTWIFSIDKISHMTLISPCHLKNSCP
ncbi:hypothetical protein [Filibacter tadaridae]|uniref:hypothetical protein n=1 Tax=Filibacter tadaridae TaxID=2483811 RepID=UPI0011CD8A51|nr:hypothetical protein [Filibacter tadaridae]